MEGGSDGDHQLERFGDCGEGGGGGPCVEAGGVDAFDVVEVEFGDQGEVEAE